MEVIQNNEFTGIDANNEISLFEYGMLCQYRGCGDYYFIYGVGVNDDGLYNRFDHCTMSREDIFNILYESWFEYDSFTNFCGIDYKEQIGSPNSEFDIIMLVSDLISYCGAENIFGSSYSFMEVVIQHEDSETAIDYKGNEIDLNAS